MSAFSNSAENKGLHKEKVICSHSLGSMKYKQFYEKKNVLAKNMNINFV